MEPGLTSSKTGAPSAEIASTRSLEWLLEKEKNSFAVAIMSTGLFVSFRRS
jgi:hypothetical protein